MRVYISGPMTGVPDWNKPAFDLLAQRLRDAGHEVFNPAEEELDHSTPWTTYLKRDLVEIVTKADALAVLPGWMDSEGAVLEICVAQALGIPCYADPPDNWAVRTIELERELDYEIVMAINLTPKPRRKDR